MAAGSPVGVEGIGEEPVLIEGRIVGRRMALGVLGTSGGEASECHREMERIPSAADVHQLEQRRSWDS